MYGSQPSLYQRIGRTLLRIRGTCQNPEEVDNYGLVQVFLCSTTMRFLFLGGLGFTGTYQNDCAVAIKPYINLYEVSDPESRIAYSNGNHQLVVSYFERFFRKVGSPAAILPLFLKGFQAMNVSPTALQALRKMPSFSECGGHFLSFYMARMQDFLQKSISYSEISVDIGREFMKSIGSEAAFDSFRSRGLIYFAASLYYVQSAAGKMVFTDVDFALAMKRKDNMLAMRLNSVNNDVLQRVRFCERLHFVLKKIIVYFHTYFVFQGKKKQSGFPELLAVAYICNKIIADFQLDADLSPGEKFWQRSTLQLISYYFVFDVLFAGINWSMQADYITKNNTIFYHRIAYIEVFWYKISGIASFGTSEQLRAHIIHLQSVKRLAVIVGRFQLIGQLVKDEGLSFSDETKDVIYRAIREFDYNLRLGGFVMLSYFSYNAAVLYKQGQLGGDALVVFPVDCDDTAKYTRQASVFAIWSHSFDLIYEQRQVYYASFLLDDFYKLPATILLQIFCYVCDLFDIHEIRLQFAQLLDKAVGTSIPLLNSCFSDPYQIDYTQQVLADLYYYISLIDKTWMLGVFYLDYQAVGHSEQFLQWLAEKLKLRYKDSEDNIRFQCAFPDLALFIMRFPAFAAESQAKKQEIICKYEIFLANTAYDIFKILYECVFGILTDKYVEFRDLSPLLKLINDFTNYLIYSKTQDYNVLLVEVYGRLNFSPPPQCVDLLAVVARHNVVFNYKYLQFIYKSRLNTEIDNLNGLAQENQALTWLSDLQLKYLSNQSAFLLSNSLMNNYLFFEVIGECYTLIDYFYASTYIDAQGMAQFADEDLELCKIARDTVIRNEAFLEFPIEELNLYIYSYYFIGATLLPAYSGDSAKFRRRYDCFATNKEIFRLFEHSIVKAKNFINEMMYNVQNKIICSLAEISQQFYYQMREELENLVKKLYQMISDIYSMLLLLLLLFATQYTRPVFQIMIYYDQNIIFQPKLYSVQEAVTLFSSIICKQPADNAMTSSSAQKFYQWAELMLDLSYHHVAVRDDYQAFLQNMSSPYLRIVIWINAILNLASALDYFIVSIGQQFQISLGCEMLTCACSFNNDFLFPFVTLRFYPANINQILLQKMLSIFSASDQFVLQLYDRFNSFGYRILGLYNIKYDLTDIFNFSTTGYTTEAEDYAVVRQLTALYDAVKNEETLQRFFVQYDSFLSEMREYQHYINNIHLGFCVINASQLLLHHQDLMYEIVKHTTEPIVRYLEDNLKSSLSKFQQQVYETYITVRECTVYSNVSLSNYERIEELLKNRFILKCCHLMFCQINYKCVEMSRFLTYRNILIHTSIEQLQTDISYVFIFIEALFDNIDYLVNNTRQVYLEHYHGIFNEIQQKAADLNYKINEVGICVYEVVQALPFGGKAGEIIEYRIKLLAYFKAQQEYIKNQLYHYYEVVYLQGLTESNLSGSVSYYSHHNLKAYVSSRYQESWLQNSYDNLACKVSLYALLYGVITDYEKALQLDFQAFSSEFSLLFYQSKNLQKKIHTICQQIGDWHVKNDLRQSQELIEQLLSTLLALYRFKNLKKSHWTEILAQIRPASVDAAHICASLLKQIGSERFQITPSDIMRLGVNANSSLKHFLANANLERDFDDIIENLNKIERNMFAPENVSNLLSFVAGLKPMSGLVFLSNYTHVGETLLSNIEHANFDCILSAIASHQLAVPECYDLFIGELERLRVLYAKNKAFSERFRHATSIQRFIKSFVFLFLLCQIAKTNWIILHTLFLASFGEKTLGAEITHDFCTIVKATYSFYSLLGNTNNTIGFWDLLRSGDSYRYSIDISLLQLAFYQNNTVKYLMELVKRELDANQSTLVQESPYFQSLQRVFSYFCHLGIEEIYNFFGKSTSLYSIDVCLFMNIEFIRKLAELLDSSELDNYHYTAFLGAYCADISFLLQRPYQSTEQVVDVSRFIQYIERFRFGEIFPFIHKTVAQYSTIQGVVFKSQNQYSLEHGCESYMMPLYRCLNSKKTVLMPTQVFPLKSNHPILQLFVYLILLIEESLCVYISYSVKSLRQIMEVSTHYESAYSPNLQGYHEFPFKLFIYSLSDGKPSTMFPAEILQVAMRIICDSALALPHDIYRGQDYGLASSLNYSMHFAQRLAHFIEALQDFSAGFVILKVSDSKTVGKKVFSIPHAYEKADCLLAMAQEELELLTVVTADKSQTDYYNQNQLTFSAIPEKNFLLYFSECISRDDLPHKYMVDELNLQDQACNPEQLILVVNRKQYQTYSCVNFLSEQAIKPIPGNKTCILSEFAAKQFEYMLTELGVCRQNRMQLSQSLNYVAMHVYADYLANGYPSSSRVFTHGYGLYTANDEDLIALQQKNLQIPKYELLSVKFLDQLSFLIFTYMYPYHFSQSSYHQSYSLNYSSTFLSQSRNNQVTNDIFGIPTIEKIEELSAENDSPSSEKIEFTITNVYNEIGWEMLGYDSNYSNIFYAYKIDTDSASKEYAHISISVIDTVLAYIFVSTFAFQAEDSYYQTFYSYDFMQLRFCRQVIEFLQGAIKIGEQFAWQKMAEQIHYILARVFPFCYKRYSLPGFEENEIMPQKMVEQIVRDRFLPYSFQIYQIDIAEISRFVYQMVNYLILLTLSGCTAVYIKVPQILYAPMLLDTFLQIFQLRNNVRLMHYDVFAFSHLAQANYSEFLFYLVERISQEDLKFLAVNPDSQSLIVVWNQEDLGLPYVKLGSSNMLIHSRLTEYYISVCYRRLMLGNRSLVASCQRYIVDYMQTRIRFTCFSAEKLEIYEQLLMRLSALDYFDSYYLASVINALCEYTVEIMLSFLDQVHKSDQFEYVRILEIEQQLGDQVTYMAYSVLLILYSALGKDISKIQPKFWQALIIFVCYHIIKDFKLTFTVSRHISVRSAKKRFGPSILKVKSIGNADDLADSGSWDYYIGSMVGDSLMYKMQSDIQIGRFFPVLTLDSDRYNTKFTDISIALQNIPLRFLLAMLRLFTTRHLQVDLLFSHELLNFLTRCREIQDYGLYNGMRILLAKQFLGPLADTNDKHQMYSIMKVSQEKFPVNRQRFVTTSYNQVPNYHSDQLVILIDVPAGRANRFKKGSNPHINQFVIEVQEREIVRASNAMYLRATEYFLINSTEIMLHFSHETFYDNIYRLQNDLQRLALEMSSQLGLSAELFYIISLVFLVENSTKQQIFVFLTQYQYYLKQIIHNYQHTEVLDPLFEGIRARRVEIPVIVLYEKNTAYNGERAAHLHYSQNSSLTLSHSNARYKYRLSNKETLTRTTDTLYLSNLEPDSFEMQKLLFFFQLKQNLEIINAKADTLDYVQHAVALIGARFVVYQEYEIADFFANLCSIVLYTKKEVYVLLVQTKDSAEAFVSDIIEHDYPRGAFENADINRDIRLFYIFEYYAGITNQMSIPSLLSAKIVSSLSVLDFIHFIVLNSGSERRSNVLYIDNDKINDSKFYPVIPANYLKSVRSGNDFIKNVENRLKTRCEGKISYLAAILALNTLIAEQIKRYEQNSFCIQYTTLEQQQLHVNQKQLQSKTAQAQRLATEIQQMETAYASQQTAVKQEQRALDYITMMSSQLDAFMNCTLHNLQLLARGSVFYFEKLHLLLYSSIKKVLPMKYFVPGRGENLDKLMKQLRDSARKASPDYLIYIQDTLYLETISHDTFIDPNTQYRSTSGRMFAASEIDSNIFAFFDINSQMHQLSVYRKKTMREFSKRKAESLQSSQQLAQLRSQEYQFYMVISQLIQHIATEEAQLDENRMAYSKYLADMEQIKQIQQIYYRMSNNALFNEQYAELCRRKLEYNTYLFANYIQTQERDNSKIQLFLEQKFGASENTGKHFFLSFARQYFSIRYLIALFYYNKNYNQQTSRLMITKNDIIVTYDKLIFMLDDNLSNEQYFEQLFGLFDNSFFSLEDALADNIIMSLDPNLTLVAAKIQNENYSIVLDAENKYMCEYLSCMLENPHFKCEDMQHSSITPLSVATTVEQIAQHIYDSNACTNDMNTVIIVKSIPYSVVQPLMHGRSSYLLYRYNYQTNASLETQYTEISSSNPVRVIFEAPLSDVQDQFVSKYKIRHIPGTETIEENAQVHRISEQTLRLLDAFITCYCECARYFDVVLELIRSEAKYETITANYADYKTKLNMLLAAAIRYKRFIAYNIQ